MCKLFSKPETPEDVAIQAMLDYALLFVGTPYRWGGSNPIDGFDCSGYAQECLASVGLDPPGDQTAQSLHDHFLDVGLKIETVKPGALVFYGKSVDQITHVAIGKNGIQIVEAGGGGSATITHEMAAKQNAFVRIRHPFKRADVVAILMPDYSLATV